MKNCLSLIVMLLLGLCLGIANEDQSFIEKALACFMVAIRNDIKNYEAQLGAARVYNKLNQPETALNMAKKAIELKATGEASWEFARACITLNRTIEAKSALEKVFETDKANIDAARELGNIYYNAKDYKKAIPVLRSVFASQANSEVAYKIGTAYKTIPILDSAAYFLNESLKDSKSTKHETAVDLARIYFQMEKFSEAANQFNLINQSMLSADDLYKYGFSIEKSNQDKDASAKIYEAAVKKYGTASSKDALRAKEMVGRWKLLKKQFRDALTLFDELLKIDPQAKTIPDLFVLLADAYDGLGDRLKAIPLLEKFTAANKENIDVFARLADLYNKEKMADKAQAIYEKLITMQPNNPKVFMALGENGLKSKKFEDALRYFQKSFTLEQNALAAVGMMNAAWELKRYDLAQDAAETALHHNPDLREPQIILAKIYINNSNWTAAIQIIELLVKQEPNNKVYWLNLASCYEKTGEASKVAKADKAIMNIDKNEISSRVRYGKYSLANNDLKSALEVYKELAQLTPKDPVIFKNIYDISIKVGNQDEAIVNLRKYTQLKPQDAGALKELGNILYDKKDNAGALAAFKTALKADPAIKGLYKKYADLMMAQKGQETEIISVLSSAVKAGEADEEIYLTLGDIYLKQENYSQAIEMFSKSLQLKPQNFNTLSSIAFCQEKTGKISDAILSYEQAVAMNGTAVKETKSLGDLYWQQGKKDPAIASYKKYIEKSPTDSKVAKIIGDFEYDRKNYNDAVKYLSMVSGTDAKNSDFMSRYGDAVYQTNDLKKASEIFKTIASSNPKNPEPFKILFQIARKNKDLGAAAEYLKQYTVLRSSDVPMLQTLGDIYYELKNAQGALSAYRAVLKIDPTVKGFYGRYVELVNQSGNTEEKVQALSGAIAAGEAEPPMYAQLGNLFKASGDCQKAMPNLEKATQFDSKNSDLLISLAECQAKTGAVDKSIINYEQALVMVPKASKEYRALGDLYIQQKKTDLAIRSYKKYLEQASDNAIARQVAENALAAKNYLDAIKYFGLITGDDSKSVSVLSSYGKACLEGQDNDKAIAIYRQLATLTPQNPEVFKALYDLFSRSGAKDDALLNLKSYIALKGADAQAQKTLGDILYERKDNTDALRAYRAALKADPAIKDIYARYAELLMIGGGKDEEMVVALNGAIASGEANVSIYVRLGEIYRKQGNFAKASQMYDKASQLDNKNTLLLTELADCQAKSGNAGASILTYEQAVSMNPSAVLEFKALGDLYTSQNKTDAALKNYKKYLEKNADNQLAFKVGQQLYSAKNFTDAVKYFGMITGAEAAKVEVLRPYGEATYQLKDDVKAYRIYKQISVLTPKDPVVFQRLCDISGRTGTKDEMLFYLKKYSALNPGDAAAQKTLGDMLYANKNFGGAVDAYRAALKADPEVKGIYPHYAELLMNNGGTESELASVLNGAIAAGEADVKMYVRLGEIFVKQADNTNIIPNKKGTGKGLESKKETYVKACKMYEKATQLDPRNVVLLTRLAECQYSAGNIDASIMTYEQSIAMNPSADKEFKAIGDLYLQLKRIDAAVSNYKKYLEKNKDAAIAQLVGEFAFNGKNYPEAVKYLGMISGQETSNVKYLRIYGEACYQSKDYIKSFQIFKQLATVTPQDPVVYKKLYDLAGRAGTREEVLLYLKKYTSLNQGDAVAQKDLGNMLYEQKDFPGALNAYRAALKADPASKGFYPRYAELLMKNGGSETEIISALNGAISANEADVNMYTRLGEIHFKQSNFAKAAQMYEKASQINTKDPSLLTKLAESQAKSGNTNAAILTYEQAIAMNIQASKEYKQLGDLYMLQKRQDIAINNYKKYLEKNTDNNLAKLIGEYANNAKNYTVAIKYFGLVVGTEASTADFLKMYADACYSAKDDFKSYQIYKQLSELTPKEAAVFQRLAEIAKRAGTRDEVLMYLKKYVALRPSDVNAQKALGDMLYDNKDIQGAIAAYRAILKADPAAKGFYSKYAELVMINGSDAEVISVLNGAINAGEADVKMYSRLGSIYIKRADNIVISKKTAKENKIEKQESFDNACKMLEKASQLDPKNTSLLVMLAEYQSKAGKTNAAILTYEQAIAMNSQANGEYKALGDLYMQQSKIDKAVNAYKKYIEKNANNAIANLIGEYCYKQKHYAEAVKYLGLVSGTDAATAAHLKLYGNACYQAKDDFKAFQILKQLAILTPQDQDVFVKLYDVASRAGTRDEVLTYLKKVTVLKPGDAKAYKTLGDMLYENKENQGALNAYRSALKADPSLKGFYKRYAALVMTKGSDDERVLALKGAIASNEADASMYATLAGIYKKQNQAAKAIELYQKASQVDPKNIDLLSDLADCQVKNGNISDAIMTYEQVVAVNTMANTEYKQLGDLYAKQNKVDQSIKAYKRYLEKNPSDYSIAKIVGEQAYKAKNYPDALKYFGMVTSADSKQPSFLQMFADAAYHSSDNPKALRVYQELAVLTPNDPVVFKRLYEISLKAGASGAGTW